MGGYERNPATFGLDGIPADFNGRLLAPDWPRFEEISAGAVRRVPAMADAGVRQLINGPEGFTPDNEFILGESEVRGFFVAAGFSAHGIAGAGGWVARWRTGSWTASRRSTCGPWTSAASGRSTPRATTRWRARSRTTPPTTTSTTRSRSARPEGRCGSPHVSAAGRLDAPSVRRRAGSGRTGSSRTPLTATRRCACGWAGRHWSPAIGASAGYPPGGGPLRDELLQDRDQRARRPRLSGAPLRQPHGWPVGRITYTQMLNRRGGIECDFTVTRLAEDRFWIVTGTAFGNHDLGWIRRHAPDDGSVEVADLTHASVPGHLGSGGTRDRWQPDR